MIIGAVRQHFPPETIVFKPEGGIYLWVILPKEMDLNNVLENSQKRGVTFGIGNLFYLDDKGSDRIRLQFSLEDEEKILEGVKIIGEELSNEIHS